MDKSIYEQIIKAKYANLPASQEKYEKQVFEVTVKFTVDVSGYKTSIFSDNIEDINKELNKDQYLYDGQYKDNFENLLRELQDYIKAKYTKIAMGDYWENPIIVSTGSSSINVAEEVAREYVKQNHIYVSDEKVKWEIKELKNEAGSN